MQSAVVETGLTITNPLVLYRALVATKKIESDPAQHRLAIHLQKLYHRLKDYEPSIEYRHRLEQVARTIGPQSAAFPASPASAESEGEGDGGGDSVRGDGEGGRRPRSSGLWSAFRTQTKAQADSLALTRTLTSHEAALEMDSPQGLLLYGEVGTGKSFLVDLLAESLPNRKKRRYHFNAFMLDTFARLEQQRLARTAQRSSSSSSSSAGGDAGGLGLEHEHTLLSLARDMVTTSPILFLDEFQLPDRASSKILSSLFTSFFQLGGVLVATSNRMPEELSKASGVEFTAPPISSSRLGLSGLRRMFGASVEDGGRGMFARQSDFAQFLEVLKARCETWNMESKTDFRRRDSSSSMAKVSTANTALTEEATNNGLNAGDRSMSSSSPSEEMTDEAVEADESGTSLPAYFFHQASDLLSTDTLKEESLWHAAVLQAVSPSQVSLDEIPWQTGVLNVYGRKVQIPKTFERASMWTFEQLCGTYLGPADYISLASNYQTIILDEVPVLSFLQKNEARRFITLLDALYEAKCRLLIRADAGPDDLFFPEARGLGSSKTDQSSEGKNKQDLSDDGVYAETLSEIYQDQTMPFRPNISSYSGDAPEEHFTNSAAKRQGGAHPMTRSILSDEDADFGPVYGAGRSAGSSTFDPAEEDRKRMDEAQSGPNFQRAGAFTGEDEKFAYKRAESRLWELCSQRWWDNALGTSWWKPLSKEARSWEDMVDSDAVAPALDAVEKEESEKERERLFRHGASPFRVHQDPPPKIPWTHTWGMMKWGRKAGTWGKGVEAAEERLEEKKREREMMERIQPKPRS